MNRSFAFVFAPEFIVVLLALVISALLIPASSPLGRSDGAGLVTLAVSVTALLWGRRLGAGPHPTLQPRGSRFGGLFRALARALAPWALWAAFESARSGASTLLAVALCGACALFAVLGRDHGRTAWNPGPHGVLASARQDLRLLLPAVLIVVAGVLGLVLLDQAAATLGFLREPTWVPALLSCQTILVCALSGRMRNLRQRAAMAMGDEHLPAVFWASVGPGLTLLALGALMADFEQDRLHRAGLEGGLAGLGLSAPTLMAWHRPALVLAVALWARGLWRPRAPSAILCSWREVVPRGADVAMGSGAIPGFEHPPAGALRINAWATRDTGRVVYWPVPVRDVSWNPLARLPDLRAESRSASAPHLLGEAAFEPQTLSGRIQTEKLTVRPVPGRRTALGGQTQAVLIRPNRPHDRGGERGREQARSWTWQDPGVPGRIRIVGEQSLHLHDGDLLLLSADGVATAWRLEYGPEILPGDPANRLDISIQTAGES